MQLRSASTPCALQHFTLYIAAQHGCCLAHAGTEEGGYAWLTINYLLGKLGAKKDDTVAVVDLGGGSVQMAYAMADAEAKKAPSGYIQTLSGGGKSYNVYMHRCFSPSMRSICPQTRTAQALQALANQLELHCVIRQTRVP